MPSSSQRIQVLLKPASLQVVKELAEEEDLTLSKMVAKLAEEALTARGLLKKGSNSSSTGVLDSLDLKNLAGSGYTVKTVSKKTEPIEDEDLKLLQKFKQLRALGLFE